MSKPKSKSKISKKTKSHMVIAFLFFGTIISWLSYNFFSNINQIMKMRDEKKYLQARMIELKEEEEVLKSDIQKLEDPTYIARYAREKYLYSKDGELIIRIPDN